ITPFAVLLLTDRDNIPNWAWILPILLTFELFSVNIDRREVYQILPPNQQPIMQEPPLVTQAKYDAGVFRVDGQYVDGELGVYGYGNSGSLYQLEDIRGISPLFLDSAYSIIQLGTPFEKVWEVFSVKYIFTDAEELPAPSELIGRDYPHFKTLNLHQLTDPRPFALLMYRYEVIADDESARARLNSDDFNPREVVIINQEPALVLPDTPPDDSKTDIITYTPEYIEMRVNTSENALLSVALVDYPGWRAEIDGQPVETYRAYSAMTAIPIEAGEYVVTLTYNPTSYQLGAIISLITWAGCIGLALFLTIRFVVRRS
ncbi:MAG: YfhO family protein, partial [Anaerolineae bacterium]|nr:YfhO family protein [Anaerolineae bacterium]